MRTLRDQAHAVLSVLQAWRYRRLGMQIGKGCKISRWAKLDRTNPKGVKIGDFSAVSFDAVILTHDFIKGRNGSVEIGSNCFIGARSVIMPGVKIGDHSIVGIGSVVFTDVPPSCVVSGNPARVVETGIRTGKWGIRDASFLGLEEGASAPPSSPSKIRRRELSDILSSYLPPAADHNRSFADLGVDSFALITLRAEIEENARIQIPDSEWVEAEAPADLTRLLMNGKAQAGTSVRAATAQRRYQINMPQMAMGGLSEPWLFKEVGDIHWSILTSALGLNSRSITDQGGARLYATFTRIKYKAEIPFCSFSENEDLHFTAAMTRFGAGLFFSSVQGKSPGGDIRFEVMSSFSKFAEEGDNKSLVKGQPSIPDDFAIPSLHSLPDFASEYRALRSEPEAEAIFSTEYELVPNHDINGVGLLYFAAYPTIADICLRRYLGEDWHWSPVERDCCYYANSGPHDKIRFNLLAFTDAGGEAHADATLTRSDGTRMALIRTRMLRC